jgi:hypothetical protein
VSFCPPIISSSLHARSGGGSCLKHPRKHYLFRFLYTPPNILKGIRTQLLVVGYSLVSGRAARGMLGWLWWLYRGCVHAVLAVLYTSWRRGVLGWALQRSCG